jgi:macrolide-specific efflux system membrane fusion protein
MNKKWVLSAIFLVLFLVAGIFFIQKTSPKEKYQELPVGRSDIQIEIQTTGTVQPENRLEIKPQVPGRIEKVLVEIGQKVKKGQVLAWMSSTERAAMLDAAQSQGPEEVKKWQEMYQPTAVLAPLDGTVIVRNIETGQTVAVNEAIFIMADILTVKALIDETDLSQIYRRQKARIELDAYPTDKIEAVVDRIAFDAKTVSNVTTYTVDVLPIKTPSYFRSGMTANVRFVGPKKESVLVIRNDWVKYKDGKPLALVKGPQGPMEKEIELGISDGKKTEILSGLQEGDIILKSTSVKEFKPNSNPFSPMGNQRRGSK